MRAIRDRNALLYLGGVGLSGFGSSVFALTAGVWVKVLTGSDTLAGLVSFCVWGPALAMPLFGVLVDRVRRRRLVVVVSVGIAAALLTLFAVDGPDDVWLLFTVMTAYGVVLAVLQPVEVAILVDAVPGEALPTVNSARSTLSEGWKIVGPPLGVGLFTVAGGGVLALVDAVTFLVSAVAFALIGVVDVPRRRDGARWYAELRDGVRHVLGDAELRALLGGCGAVLTLFGMRAPTNYALVEQGLGMPPAFVGVLAMLQGVGSVAGGVVAMRWLRSGRENGFAALGMVAAAVGALLLCTTSLALVVAGMVLTGVGVPWLLVAGATKVQLATPVELQGRAASITHLLLFTGMTLGMPVGSVLAGYVDYRLVLLAFAAVAAGAALPVWLRGRPGRTQGRR